MANRQTIEQRIDMLIRDHAGDPDKITGPELNSILKDFTGNYPNTDGANSGEVFALSSTDKGVAAPTGIRLLDDGGVLASDNFGINSNTLSIGDNVDFGEVGSFLSVLNKTIQAAGSDTQFVVVDHRIQNDGPSSNPRIFRRPAGEAALVVQAEMTDDITIDENNPLSFSITTTADEQINSFMFNVATMLSNARVKITDASSNIAIKYLPTKTAWVTGEDGIDVAVSPPGSTAPNSMYSLGTSQIVVDSGTTLNIEVRADSGVLRGDSNGVPQLNVMRQTGEYVDLILADDGAVIKDALEDLTGDDRLDASAIKNLPTRDATLPASSVTVDSTDLTGLINGSGNVQTALARIDALGIGAHIVDFSGSYSAQTSNINEWFNGRANVHMQGIDGQSCARRTFTLPGTQALTTVFDALNTAGLPETFTLLISYFGCSSTSSLVNSLRVNARSGGPAYTDTSRVPVLNRGDSVTLQISRNGGTIGTWEVLNRGVITTTSGSSLNDIELQTRTWANRQGTFLPGSDDVLKGYAFRVTASADDTGAVRSDIADNLVGDPKVMYDGDWVVWSGGSFTNWLQGSDWFVLPANEVRRITQEQDNFLRQVTETDRPFDVRSEDDGAADALAWYTNEDAAGGGILSTAPFLDPAGDTARNPSGGTQTYRGGRTGQNSDNDTVVATNGTGLLYVVISTNYLNQHSLSDIHVEIRDLDGTVIQRLNLNDNFVKPAFSDNSTGQYFVYSQHKISDSFTQIRYRTNEKIAILTTRQDDHYTLSDRVNTTTNVSGLQESQLSQEVQGKLNARGSLAPIDRARLDGIETSTGSAPLPGDMQFKVKFGDISANDADYRTLRADYGYLQDFQQTVSYVIRVPHTVTLSGFTFVGGQTSSGSVTLAEHEATLFANEKVYILTIPSAPDNINYNPLDHPIVVTGTVAPVEATGLVPAIKVDAENFEQSFLDSIVNHADTAIPAPLLALNNQAEVIHFDNTNFVSNNEHAGIGSMFSFLKNRPDERQGDSPPTNTNLMNEITNGVSTATIANTVGLFYPRTISGEFDNGVDVTTQGALVGPGAVNEPVTLTFPSDSNYRMVLGMWFDFDPIAENTIRNLIRVKEVGSTGSRRLFGLEGTSRINDAGHIETGAVITERVQGSAGSSSQRTVTHNLYTTNGEINHTFSGVGAAETLFRVNEARTYTFESRLISNGNDEGSSTNSVTISNINQDQSFGTHDFTYTVNGHSHTQQVTIEYVAASSTYGGPGHTLRFELLGGLTDNVNFDIDHLIVSCHYETTETVVTPASYAEANAGGTPILRSRKKHRIIMSFRKSSGNDNLECHYVVTGFDSNNAPIVSTSNVVDFGYSVFDLDWSQVTLGNTNMFIAQNIQGFHLNTDTPLAQFPTHAMLNGWITSHDDKATDYVWGNASAPERNIEVVRFPENVTFPNQIIPIGTKRFRAEFTDNGDGTAKVTYREET